MDCLAPLTGITANEPRVITNTKRKAPSTTDGAPNAQVKKYKAGLMKMHNFLQSSGQLPSPALIAAIDALLAEVAQPPPLPVISSPVTKLSVQEILHLFSFSYNDTPFLRDEHIWDMEEDSLTENALLLIDAAGTRLTCLLFLYGSVGVRDHEAICRIPADQVFLEAIGICNGQGQILLDELTKWTKDLDDKDFSLKRKAGTTLERLWSSLAGRLKRRTPTQLTRMQLFGEMDLEYTRPPSESDTSITPAIYQYTGRCDYSIGIALRPPLMSGKKSPLHISVLLVCEAKKHNNIAAAVNQLFGYLGILHAERKSAGKRRDCTTYGVATDGYKWVFVKVTHTGKVLKSPDMDITIDGGCAVLRALVFVLRESMKLQTPENSPARYDEDYDDDSDRKELGARGEFLTMLADENVNPTPREDEVEEEEEEDLGFDEEEEDLGFHEEEENDEEDDEDECDDEK